MAKIELILSDPYKIDSGLLEPQTIWTYAGTDYPLVLDTDDGTIECEALGKKATISYWVVNAENHTMKLFNDSSVGNFSNIDGPFVVAAVGQLVSKIGLPAFQNFLQMIDNDMPPFVNQEENKENTEVNQKIRIDSEVFPNSDSIL